MDELISKTEQFVITELAHNDASHDYQHIMRVRIMAKKIAVEEGLAPGSIQIVELAALLHDVVDWKYHNADAMASKEFAVEVSEK